MKVDEKDGTLKWESDLIVHSAPYEVEGGAVARYAGWKILYESWNIFYKYENQKRYLSVQRQPKTTF